MNVTSTNAFSAPAATGLQAAQGKSAASALSSSTPSESMFLQLLVAQLKNQDPSTPSDPTQFVGELATFSQLEQTIQIRQDADTVAAALAPSQGSGTPVIPVGN